MFKVMRKIAFAGVMAIGSVLSAYDNFTNSSLTTDRKITNTIVDIGMLALSYNSPIPLVIGLIDMTGLPEKYIGTSILNDMKDKFNWLVTEWVPSIGDSIVQGAKDFGSWVYSWHWWW